MENPESDYYEDYDDEGDQEAAQAPAGLQLGEPTPVGTAPAGGRTRIKWTQIKLQTLIDMFAPKVLALVGRNPTPAQWTAIALEYNH